MYSLLHCTDESRRCFLVGFDDPAKIVFGQRLRTVSSNIDGGVQLSKQSMAKVEERNVVNWKRSKQKNARHSDQSPPSKHHRMGTNIFENDA